MFVLLKARATALFAGVISIFVFSGSVAAQSSTDGVYFKPSIGITNPKNDTVGSVATDYESGFHLGLAAGMTYNASIDVEGEFFYSSADADKTGSITDGDYSGYGFMANAYYNFHGDKIVPYVGMGIGFASADTNLTSGGTQYTDDSSGLGYQFMGGARMKLNHQTSLNAEIRYRDVQKKQWVPMIGLTFHPNN